MTAIDPPGPRPTVVADIGGTHARFAWLTPAGAVGPVTKLATRAFAGVAAALEAFRDQTGGPRPARLGLAVAAPVIGDDVALTNAHWRFCIRDASGLCRIDEIRPSRP